MAAPTRKYMYKAVVHLEVTIEAVNELPEAAAYGQVRAALAQAAQQDSLGEALVITLIPRAYEVPEVQLAPVKDR